METLTVVRDPSPEAVEWAARRSKDMHEEPPSKERAAGRCKQCQAGGWCPQYAWARGYLQSVEELAESV